MQRPIMRVAGRLTMGALLALMVLAITSNPEQVHKHYMAKYDQFRNMLYMLRIVDFPPSKYIEGLFDILRHIDTGYLALSGLLIVFGFRPGAWMLVWYLVFKSLVFYIPPIVNIPRVVFINRDVLDMIRHFALLGAAIAFTYTTPKAAIKQASENSQREKTKDQ